MLALETSTSAAWTLQFTFGAMSDTYPNSLSVPAPKQVHYLVEWLNDAARPWYGLRTWSWSWQRNTDLASGYGGAILKLSGQTAWSYSCTAGDFHAATGLPNSKMLLGTYVVGDESAAGTWAPPTGLAIRNWAHQLGAGDCGNGNVIRPGVQGMGEFRPKIDAIGSPLDVNRLQAVLAAATSPRRAWAYQQHTDTWLDLAVGRMQLSALGLSFYSMQFDCAGEVM